MPIITAYAKYIIGKRAKVEPPIASVKKPAPIERTIAVFALSQRAAARISPIIRSGVLGQSLKTVKNEH